MRQNWLKTDKGKSSESIKNDRNTTEMDTKVKVNWYKVYKYEENFKKCSYFAHSGSESGYAPA